MPPLSNNTNGAQKVSTFSVSSRICAEYNLRVDPQQDAKMKPPIPAHLLSPWETEAESTSMENNNNNNSSNGKTNSEGTTGVSASSSSSSTTPHTIYLPPFVEGKSLKEAVRDANAATKYLLVYLHASDHEDTTHFITSVFSKTSVVEKLKEIAIVYFVDAYSSEGRALESIWSISQFPYCSLLVKGRVVGDLQGRFDEKDFLDFLTSCDDVARPIIHQEVAFVYERNMREKLRAHQEAEMEEAERTDRERIAQAKKAEEERKKLEEEMRRQEAAERAERIERERRELEEKMEKERREEEARIATEAAALELETLKARAASALPDEPPEDTDASLIAKIRIVDLRGKPTNRAFYRTDSVKTLYMFAKTIEGYCGGPFALMAGFPPKALVPEEEADSVCIGDIPSLFPRSVVTMKAL